MTETVNGRAIYCQAVRRWQVSGRSPDQGIKGDEIPLQGLSGYGRNAKRFVYTSGSLVAFEFTHRFSHLWRNV